MAIDTTNSSQTSSGVTCGNGDREVVYGTTSGTVVNSGCTTNVAGTTSGTVSAGSTLSLFCDNIAVTLKDAAKGAPYFDDGPEPSSTADVAPVRGTFASSMTTRPEFQSEQFRKGLEVRRAVLGAEHVDASLTYADDFMAPIQKLTTEFAWGEVWTRPGLDRKTRSMLNLAMMTALNRPHELKLHVRGAINNGVTREEISEVLLHTSLYCGLPASLDAFRTTSEILKEIDESLSKTAK